MAYDLALRSIEAMLRTTVCPTRWDNGNICGAQGFWGFHGRYPRKTIRDWVNGRIVDYEGVKIKRLCCKKCGGTHAMLIWILPPYSRHTLRYILHVLDEGRRGMTIAEICQQYQISANTFYAWKKKFEEDAEKYKTLIGIVITSDEILQLMLLCIQENNPTRFEAYQLTFGAAFMQMRHTDSRSRKTKSKARPPP